MSGWGLLSKLLSPPTPVPPTTSMSPPTTDTPTTTVSQKKRSRSGGSSDEKKSKLAHPAPPKLLPTPIMPPKECPSKYRFLRLRNGVRVFLISNQVSEGHLRDPSWTNRFPTLHPDQPPSNWKFDFENTRKLFLQAPNVHDHQLKYLKGLDEIMTNSDNVPQSAHTINDENNTGFSMSVSVNTGSYSDPEKFQGLAHLIEHVVHYGSLKYPGEQDFIKFIRENNGFFNAFTAPEQTNYHCELDTSNPEVIKEVCERYALMLSSPLLTSQFLIQELEAVDTEHYMRRPNMSVQADYLIYNQTIDDEGHPLKNFACGSKETFLPDGIATPEAIAALKTAAHRFLATHYFGGNIAIVLATPENLDTIQEIVVATFDVISPVSKFPHEVQPPGRILPYNMERYNRLFIIKPPRCEGHQLVIQWALHPSIWQNYKAKPLEYVKNLLKNEDPKGLPHYLREQGWIEWMSPYLSSGSQYYTELAIVFALTTTGRECVQKVMEATFSFLKLHQCKGPQEVNFNEMKRVDDFIFEHQELDISAAGLICLSTGIFRYEMADIITGSSFASSHFDKVVISNALNQLIPSNANFILFTWDVPEGTDLTIKLFGTKYRIDQMAEDVCSWLENVRPLPAFDLNITENPFTFLVDSPHERPNTFQMSDDGEKEKMSNVYMPNSTMASPQGILMVAVKTGLELGYIRQNGHLMDTWVKMLNLTIISKTMHQKRMDTLVNASSFNRSIVLKAIGFQNGLLSAATALLDAFDEALCEATFNLAKEATLGNYFTFIADSIYLAFDYYSKLRNKEYVTAAEGYEKLNELSFKDMLTFVGEYKKEMKFMSMALGSVRRDEEARLAERVSWIKTDKIQPKKEVLSERKSVPLGVRCLRLKSLADAEKVVGVMNYYEGDASTTNAVNLMSFISSGIADIVFCQLRTVEQLGYLVDAWWHRDRATNKSGLIIIVGRHVDKHCPCYIDSRMDNLLTTFYNNGKLDEYIEKSNLKPAFAAKVRPFYAQYLLPGSSTMAKLSIQIETSKNCLCQSKQVTRLCKKPAWRNPALHYVGTRKLEIALAGDSHTDDTLPMIEQMLNRKFFVPNIEKYHEEG